MKTEKVEDRVLKEIPVYLSKSLSGQLHVFQYSVRPHAHNYDTENITKALIKPKSGQMELEIGLRTTAPYFDRKKGEQIASSVDGFCRDKADPEDNFYSSNTMDKLVLSSSRAVPDTSRYAVGVMGEGSLHLSPIESIIAMKPSFNYLDMADKRSKLDEKEQMEVDSDGDEVTKKVTVRFERPETERSKQMKEKSYGFLQKQIMEESWVPLNYHSYGSERSEFESRYLYCSYPDENVDQFTLDSSMYLSQLIPPITEGDDAGTALPANLLSLGALKAIPLQERLKTIIQNAGVASFMDLVNAVSNLRIEETQANILKAVQNMSVLVQGNWVVKSDIVFPKDTASESGVSNEILQRARDYTLYLFTKNHTIKRSDISDTIETVPQDMKTVLEGVARCKGGRGTWEFLLPTDTAFIKKHPDVVQRQQMIWQSRYEQLSQYFVKR